MPKKSEGTVITKPVQGETKHELSNKQQARLLDDLETLNKNVILGNTILTMEEK